MSKLLKNLSLPAVILGALVSLTFSSPVEAAGFNAGRIIDDDVFTNKSTMNPSQIQDLLNAKVPRCDTWGEQPYAGTTRAQYAASRGVSTPFTCLKDYTQDGKRASQIIYDVAQKYSINPQILIVLLQKEQGLITDDWPWPIQYRSATGYGCPDTADCSAQYYGFTNQVDWAARMFRAILDDSPDWYTPYELGNNFIQYSPDASCGGSTVYIQNRSTQALYNYTPYQPNQAALDAGWDTAPCGAYGNRNFYLYFTSWFGESYKQFEPLSLSRWMQLKTASSKYNVFEPSQTGTQLSQGQQILFTTKINYGGITYLRTAHDTNGSQPWGVRLSDLEEIPYESMAYPRWMQLNKSAYKQTPRSGTNIDKALSLNQAIRFTSKTTVNGTVYLRSAHDTDLGYDKGIPLSFLENVEYEPLGVPRWMEIKEDTFKRSVHTDSETGDVIPKGTHLLITSKMMLNDVLILRDKNDTDSNKDSSLRYSDLKELSFLPLEIPRSMVLTKDSVKYDIRSTTAVNAPLSQGQEIKFRTKIFVNGIWYLRTEVDTSSKVPYGILLSDLREVN